MSDALQDAAARVYREAGGDASAATDLLDRWIGETPELRAEAEAIYSLDRRLVARALVQEAERRARRVARKGERA